MATRLPPINHTVQRLGLRASNREVVGSTHRRTLLSNNLGKVVHTATPLSHSSMIWVTV